MLNDRNYMGNPIRDSQRFGTSALMALVIVNVVVFVIQSFTEIKNADGKVISDSVSESMALVATEVQKGQIYRLFTYMFLHGDFYHILFNMWGLYLFGSLIEPRIGPLRFFNLYIISGLFGSGLWMLFNWGSSVPCIGASGSLVGITLAAAMFYPDVMIMLLLPPVPMKLKTFAVVFVIIEVIFEFTGGLGGIAHLVHLGGFLGGYIYIKYLYRDQIAWDFFSFIFRKKRGLCKVDGTPAGWSMGKSDIVSQKELDRVLDKISRSGINSLSEEEMETLRKAREQMNAERQER